MTDFLDYLKNTSYPGRGIAVGKNRVYYFIMGRSENSRNRIFTLTEDGIRTEAFDPAKVTDPSLIIYHPVRAMGTSLIITNGNQTDTIRDMGDFRAALATREYEPDEPNWTPRAPMTMRAATRGKVILSAPIRVTALRCRALPENRCRSICRSRNRSGRL